MLLKLLARTKDTTQVVNLVVDVDAKGTTVVVEELATPLLALLVNFVVTMATLSLIAGSASTKLSFHQPLSQAGSSCNINASTSKCQL